MGSVEPLKKLYALWQPRLHLVDVVVRQAHPGPEAPAYAHFEQKMTDARHYQEHEDIPWTVLVDDLAGTTHQVYGGLFDPTYLIDADGRVAFYNLWTHAPTLHQAITALMRRGGLGVVTGGVDRRPHVWPALTDGWKGLRRGLPQSFIELEMAAPLTASSTWLGYQLRPLLAPLTLRPTPLPRTAQMGLAIGAVALFGLLARRLWSANAGHDAREDRTLRTTTRPVFRKSR